MELKTDELVFIYDLQWFAKDGPGGEKTEPATEKKLREAREDGKVSKSKELVSAFDLIVFFLLLKFLSVFSAEVLKKHSDMLMVLWEHWQNRVQGAFQRERLPLLSAQSFLKS